MPISKDNQVSDFETVDPFDEQEFDQDLDQDFDQDMELEIETGESDAQLSVTDKSESWDQFDARAERAEQLLLSQGPVDDENLDAAISDLILNLYCLVAQKGELNASEFASNTLIKWERYADRSRNLNVSVILEDLDERKPSVGTEQNAFISYGAEDTYLAHYISLAWNNPTLLGRSVHDDALIRRVINETLDKSKSCIIFGSPVSIDWEPSLRYILRAAQKRSIPTNIVSRSFTTEWEAQFKLARMLGQQGDTRNRWLSYSLYTSGSVNKLVREIEDRIGRTREAMTDRANH